VSPKTSSQDWRQLLLKSLAEKEIALLLVIDRLHKNNLLHKMTNRNTSVTLCSYKKTSKERIMSDRIGQQLGNYRLKHLLGRGGFAEVYLGEHVKLKKKYAAIKVLHTLIADEELERFQQEAQMISDLQHAHIIRILDFDVQAGMPFIVMDYAPNASLRKQHPAGTLLPAEIVSVYVQQIVLALQHAHNQRIVHRDIKPENMLVGQNGEILLSDFGVATLSHNTSSLSVQTIAGTTPYMAPEQIHGHPVPASDQYALGIVVYEWLCGTRPFQGTAIEIALQHVMAQVPLLRQHNPSVHPSIEQVVLKTLVKAPQERFPDVTTFAHTLAQALEASKHTTSFAAPVFPQPGFTGTHPVPGSPPGSPFVPPGDQPTVPSPVPGSHRPLIPPSGYQPTSPAALPSGYAQPLVTPPSTPLVRPLNQPALNTPARSVPIPASIPVAGHPSIEGLEQFRRQYDSRGSRSIRRDGKGTLIVLANSDQIGQEVHVLPKSDWSKGSNLHDSLVDLNSMPLWMGGGESGNVKPQRLDNDSIIALALFYSLRAGFYAVWTERKRPVYVLVEKGIATLIDLHSSFKLFNATVAIEGLANTSIRSQEQAIEEFRRQIGKKEKIYGALILLTSSDRVGQEAHLLFKSQWDADPNKRNDDPRAEHVYIRSHQVGNYTFAAAVFEKLDANAYITWVDINIPISTLVLDGEAVIVST
jgi:serine/threonine protein kinase